MRCTWGALVETNSTNEALLHLHEDSKKHSNHYNPITTIIALTPFNRDSRRLGPFLRSLSYDKITE